MSQVNVSVDTLAALVDNSKMVSTTTSSPSSNTVISLEGGGGGGGGRGGGGEGGQDGGRERDRENAGNAVPERRRKTLFARGGALRPFRLLGQDSGSFRRRYRSDWGFNQLVLASAVYIFFTNLLPGITFASDLDALTQRNYGTIEVVFSTGLCGCIFAL